METLAGIIKSGLSLEAKPVKCETNNVTASLQNATLEAFSSNLITVSKMTFIHLEIHIMKKSKKLVCPLTIDDFRSPRYIRLPSRAIDNIIPCRNPDRNTSGWDTRTAWKLDEETGNQRRCGQENHTGEKIL